MNPTPIDQTYSGPSLHEAFANPTSRVHATCVFVDMVNSTGMKAATPESGWLPQVGFLYDKVVEAFRGDEVTLKFLGDGVVVFLPGDDRALEAIQSAIQVQQEVQDAGRPVDGAMGKINFHVTIGITTGIAHRFVTPSGATDYVGLTIDKASRLCSAASAQAIFVDRSTVSATNFNRVSSPLGRVLHRTPDEYQGERQSVTLKGIPSPVEYHEILWDAQLYGVKSELLTQSANEKQGVPAVRAIERPAGKTRIERLVGTVKTWNAEKKFGFITSDDNEDFYYSPNLVVYAEDLEDMKVGTKVAFVAVSPAGEGKSRRAGAVLVADQYADGTLTVPPAGRPYGWIEVRDGSGNIQPVFVAASEVQSEYGRGQRLNFKLEIGPRGARATDVGDEELEAA